MVNCRVRAATLAYCVDYTLSVDGVGRDFGHDDTELASDRVAGADVTLDDGSGVIGMLARHLLAVVVGDEVGRLRSVHPDFVAVRSAIVVVADVERGASQ